MPTSFLHDYRRTAARTLIRASVPERVAMRLTGHTSRAIFDRYHIIHEQELLDAGDQLVACLAQQAQAAPARRRPHVADTTAPRPDATTRPPGEWWSERRPRCLMHSGPRAARRLQRRARQPFRTQHLGCLLLRKYHAIP